MEELKRQVAQGQLTTAAFMAILERLNTIEDKLDKKVAYWLVEDAVQAYKDHISANHRCPENFNPVLDRFVTFFRGKNVATLAPVEVEAFLYSRWGGLAKSTIAKRKEQLGTFFGFCINELKRKGSPDFHNPCGLMQQIKIPPPQRDGFIDPEKMLELLNTCKDIKHWLMLSIQLTAGLRIGELLKLRPRDVSGRVLTLILPKSGKDMEYAVIPERVGVRLKEYVKYLDPERPIFPTNRRVVNKYLHNHAGMVGLDMSTHDLRRWCATFYERHGDLGMMRFILRHSSVKDSSGAIVLDQLASKYVSVLSPEEAKIRQDNLLVPALYKNQEDGNGRI